MDVRVSHTPEPWTADLLLALTLGDHQDSHWRIHSEQRDPRSIYVADLPGSGGPEGETEANARLIAAAPELLDALKEVRDYMREGRGGFWIRVDAAIAKAEGE
jgi:hypothetical protein